MKIPKSLIPSDEEEARWIDQLNQQLNEAAQKAMEDMILTGSGSIYLDTETTDVNGKHTIIAGYFNDVGEWIEYKPTWLNYVAPDTGSIYKRIGSSLEMSFDSPLRGNKSFVIECNHQWQHYEGLIEVYDFCTKCDTKRK